LAGKVFAAAEPRDIVGELRNMTQGEDRTCMEINILKHSGKILYGII